jgi:hypothetical protein
MNWKVIDKYKFITYVVVLVACVFCPFILANGMADPDTAAAAGAGNDTFWLWKLIGRLHPLALY